MGKSLSSLGWQRNNIGIGHLAVGKNSGFNRIVIIDNNLIQRFKRIAVISCREEVENALFYFACTFEIAGEVDIEQFHFDVKHFKNPFSSPVWSKRSFFKITGKNTQL